MSGGCFYYSNSVDVTGLCEQTFRATQVLKVNVDTDKFKDKLYVYTSINYNILML